MTNMTNDNALHISTANEIATTRHYKKFHTKLHSNRNHLISRMFCITIPSNQSRKLKNKMAKRRPCLIQKQKTVSPYINPSN